MRKTSRPRRSRPLGMAALTVALGVIGALIPLGLQSSEAASNAVFDFPCSSGGQITGDFNADGFPDLAVSAPGDNLEQTEVDGSIVQGVDDAGSINIIYSNGTGLAPEFHPTPRTRLYFSQNTPGIQETSEVSDNFGFAMAAGNFDGLFGTDLAIGIPGENNGRGAVQILYSGPNSTTPANLIDSDGLEVGTPGTQTYNQFLHQNSTDVDGNAEDGDNFGYAVAAGDFNGDGRDDLAVGVPKEDVGTLKDAGFVQIIFGTPHGLDARGPEAGGVHPDQGFQQGPGQLVKPEVGRAEPGDFFGGSLTTGQLNDGGPVDLAVGSPGEDVGRVPDGGAVRVMYSQFSTGMTLTESDFFTQQTKDVNGVSESADRMGCALAAGDFDGDGEDDLAVGVPGEGVGPDSNAGIVQILYNTGGVSGVSVTPNAPHANSWIEDQVWDEDEGGIPGVSKPDDRMGAALAAANFNADGAEDLAIGLPTELLYTNNRSGSVRIMYGFSGFGLTDGPGSGPAGARLPVAFAQSPSDLPSTCLGFGILADLGLLPPCTALNSLAGTNDYSPLLMVEEEGDLFGASLAAADFDGPGGTAGAALAIGSPGEDLGLFVNWLTEEEAEVPDEVLSPLLPIDEAVDAGVLNVVYPPFPAGVASGTPAPADNQDLIYRQGNSPFNPLRSFVHSLPFLQDNQIHVTPADPSESRVLTGDNFGQDQS